MTKLKMQPVLPESGKAAMPLEHKIMWGVVAVCVIISVAIFTGFLPHRVV